MNRNVHIRLKRDNRLPLSTRFKPENLVRSGLSDVTVIKILFVLKEVMDRMIVPYRGGIRSREGGEW